MGQNTQTQKQKLWKRYNILTFLIKLILWLKFFSQTKGRQRTSGWGKDHSVLLHFTIAG